MRFEIMARPGAFELILGIVESTGMVRIPTEWQSSVAFVVLFLVLLVRPRGLFGGR